MTTPPRLPGSIDRVGQPNERQNCDKFRPIAKDSAKGRRSHDNCARQEKNLDSMSYVEPLPGGNMGRFRVLIVAALGLAVSGCAAFFSQVTDQVSVNSEPPGAECRVERMAKPLGVV